MSAAYRVIRSCSGNFVAVLLACVVFVLPINPAVAQDIYHLKKADLPAPFKYAEIRGLRQDNDGYTWFTTSQGLWRFDGTDVQPFNVPNSQLPQTAVPDLVYNYNGLILLFYDLKENCELLIYNTRTNEVNNYEIDAHPGNFYESPKGELLFYSRKARLWRFSSKTMLIKGDVITGLTDWLPNSKIDNFVVDRDGITYIFYNRGRVAKIQNNKVYNGPYNEVQVEGSKLNLTYARNVLCSQAYLLARFTNGFIIYDKQSLKKIYEYDGLDVQMISMLNNRFVVFEKNGSLLPGNDKLFSTQQIPIADVTGNIKAYVDEPGTNNIMVAAQRGMYELTPNPGAAVGNEESTAISNVLKGKSVRSVYRLPNGKLYAGTYGGFYLVDKDKATLLVPNVVYCMHPIDDNTLLLGIEGGYGFAILDAKTDKFTFINDKNGSVYGFCLAKDGDSYVAGGYYDLYRIKKQADNKWDFSTFFRSDSLGAMKQILPLKNYLLIASANGLYRLDNYQKLTKIFPHNEKYAVYAIQPEGNDFWLGTAAHGLIKINNKGQILSQLRYSNGMAGDFAYSLYKANGLLFVGTNEGLSAFDPSAAMQSITPPDEPQYSEEFNHSAMFYDGYRRQLIFGGVQGLLFPDMDYYSSAKIKNADVVRLSYVKKGSNGVAAPETDLFAGMQNQIVLNPDYTFMGLKFSGNNIWRQRNFLFRITEMDTLWHKSKLDNEISFYGLAPGKYTLQARFPAVADSRYWFTKTIIVEPHFYQTWLFKIFVALILAAGIYAAWLARIRKIRSEHLLRTTIASDLHDEIGSALTRISLSSELMNIKQQMDTKVVERISSDSKSAIASISDIIWSVDARNDNKDDLVMRMKEHAYNMLDEIATVHFDVFGLDKVSTLPQLLRQNIYLIFKEAINNIAKHSTGPEVWITLNNQPAGMTIMIKNTIDPKKPRAAYAGQGLKNMQMRAKRMKANLDITTDGKCFLITIKMKRW